MENNIANKMLTPALRLELRTATEALVGNGTCRKPRVMTATTRSKDQFRLFRTSGILITGAMGNNPFLRWSQMSTGERLRKMARHLQK